MKLVQFLKIALGVTVLSLIYIFMQMQIITLAYQGKYKEKQMKKMIEENGYLTYSILTLKSSSHLGGKMLAENSSMQFADPQSVVEVAMPRTKTKRKSVNKAEKLEKPNYLLSLISLKSQAEAKQE